MLTDFNKIVLLVATILLISGLIILGIFISSSLQGAVFPPVISDCPDYWDVTNYDGKTKCINNQKINSGLSTGNCRSALNNTSFFTGTPDHIICEKSKWAKSCNIQWDGITNNSQACVEKLNTYS